MTGAGKNDGIMLRAWPAGRASSLTGDALTVSAGRPCLTVPVEVEVKLEPGYGDLPELARWIDKSGCHKILELPASSLESEEPGLIRYTLQLTVRCPGRMFRRLSVTLQKQIPRPSPDAADAESATKELPERNDAEADVSMLSDSLVRYHVGAMCSLSEDRADMFPWGPDHLSSSANADLTETLPNRFDSGVLVIPGEMTLTLMR